MSSPEQSNINNTPPEFTRRHDGMSALIERKWHQDLETFREAFDSKLDSLIGKDVKGWAHFEYLHTDPISNEVVTKEALLIRVAPNGVMSSEQNSPLVMKIVTNETFEIEDSEICLSEDILLDHEDDALYFVDACVLKGPATEESQAISYAQAFVVPADERIMFIDFKLLPPQIDISEGEQPLVPFGLCDSRVDGEYTLQKAWAILGEVWEEYPRHTGTQ